MMETWKVIPNHPEFAVSDQGEVYDRRTKKFVPTRVSPYGYLTVSVRTPKGRQVRKYVHRLVADTHLGEGYGRRVVHEDNDFSNNRATNLKWATLSETVPAGSTWGDKKAPRPVRITETGEEFPTITACAAHIEGVTQGVSMVLTGRRGSYKGYHFEYVND